MADLKTTFAGLTLKNPVIILTVPLKTQSWKLPVQEPLS